MQGILSLHHGIPPSSHHGREHTMRLMSLITLRVYLRVYLSGVTSPKGIPQGVPLRCIPPWLYLRVYLSGCIPPGYTS